MHLAPRAIILVLLLTLTVTPAAAVTISSSVSAQSDGQTQQASDGPTTGPKALATLTPFDQLNCARTDPGEATATMTDSGVSAVVIDISSVLKTEGEIPIAVDADGVAIFTQEVTNDSGVEVGYELLYNITPSELRLCPGESSSGEFMTATASFGMVITKNGVPLESISASLTETPAGPELTTTGPDLVPSLFTDGGQFGYNFAGTTQILELGDLQPGESMTVEYQLSAAVSSPGDAFGGRAQVGDPLDLGSDPGFFFAVSIKDDPVAVENASFGHVKAQFD
ncbi:MAG: hypothetical protein HKO53_08065 [Gemmatimonadetes bacterium]|nr:hypothetical protein [Gemmatimonadota bacterium]